MAKKAQTTSVFVPSTPPKNAHNPFTEMRGVKMSLTNEVHGAMHLLKKYLGKNLLRLKKYEETLPNGAPRCEAIIKGIDKLDAHVKELIKDVQTWRDVHESPDDGRKKKKGTKRDAQSPQDDLSNIRLT